MAVKTEREIMFLFLHRILNKYGFCVNGCDLKHESCLFYYLFVTLQRATPSHAKDTSRHCGIKFDIFIHLVNGVNQARVAIVDLCPKSVQNGNFSRTVFFFFVVI